jgi:hypothetical protein
MKTLIAIVTGAGALCALYFSMISFYHGQILKGIGVFVAGWVLAHISNHIFDKYKING